MEPVVSKPAGNGLQEPTSDRCIPPFRSTQGFWQYWATLRAGYYHYMLPLEQEIGSVEGPELDIIEQTG